MCLGPRSGEVEVVLKAVAVMVVMVLFKVRKPI